MVSCFQNTGHFETSALNDPKMTLTLKGQRYPIYILQLPPSILPPPPRVPNFTPYRSTASYFQVTGHFERSAPNDPKVFFNTKISNVPHIHVTITPKS